MAKFRVLPMKEITEVRGLEDVFDMQLVSEEPPSEPYKPYKPAWDPKPVSRILSALGGAVFGGLVLGGGIGALIGLGFVIFSPSEITIEATKNAQYVTFVRVVVTCIVLAGLVIFKSGLVDVSPEGMRRRQAIAAYPKLYAKYRRDLAEYQELMKEWPEELAKRQAYNSIIREARREYIRKKEEAAYLEARRNDWDKSAENAFQEVLRWRAEFFAQCVAAYGPRTSEELDRLFAEAWPHAPISGLSRMGFLHDYTSGKAIIDKIRHHLPNRIPRP